MIPHAGGAVIGHEVQVAAPAGGHALFAADPPPGASAPVEMKDADELINRILFLNGLPNVQRLNPIGVGETVEQILKADLALEEKALGDLREGIAYCESVRDFVSRDLLLKILGREEEHVDFLERQFDLIKQIGIERYVMLNAAAAPEQDD